MSGGGGESVVMSRTLLWFDGDDPNGDLVGHQEVTVSGPAPFDEFTQGNWALTGIGPFFTGSSGYAPPAPSLLNGPIGAIGQGIPWWWILGQNPQPPLPSTPAIQTPGSGASRPFYY